MVQAAATLAAAAIALVLAGAAGAVSATVGGVIGIAGTVYFSRRVFSAGPGSTPASMWRAFYTGEVFKILLTAGLFVVAIAWLELPFLPLLGGYAATLLGYWIVLPMVLNETDGK